MTDKEREDERTKTLKNKMPQVGNASLSYRPRTSALTSELAASCCREEKTRVTTQTEIAELVNLHANICPHEPPLVQFHALPTQPPNYEVDCTTCHCRHERHGRCACDYTSPVTDARITLLRPRHDGLVSCSYAHGYMSSS